MIDASPETPAALMYIQQNRKKVTNLLEMCRGPLDVGTVRRPARRQSESGIGPEAVLFPTPLERRPSGALRAASAGYHGGQDEK